MLRTLQLHKSNTIKSSNQNTAAVHSTLQLLHSWWRCPWRCRCGLRVGGLLSYLSCSVGVQQHPTELQWRSCEDLQGSEHCGGLQRSSANRITEAVKGRARQIRLMKGTSGLLTESRNTSTHDGSCEMNGGVWQNQRWQTSGPQHVLAYMSYMSILSITRKYKINSENMKRKIWTDELH